MCNIHLIKVKDVIFKLIFFLTFDKKRKEKKNTSHVNNITLKKCTVNSVSGTRLMLLRMLKNIPQDMHIHYTYDSIFF